MLPKPIFFSSFSPRCLWFSTKNMKASQASKAGYQNQEMSTAVNCVWK